MLQPSRTSRSGGAKEARPETCSFVPETLPVPVRTVPIGAASAESQGSPPPAKTPFVLGSSGPRSKARAALDMTLPSLTLPSASKLAPPAPQVPARSSSLPPPSPKATLSVAVQTPIAGSTRATAPVDATVEVGDDDVSIFDARRVYLPPPPPLPRKPRLAQPKLVWGMVAVAWCVMVCLALLAVDEPRPTAADVANDAASRRVSTDAAPAAAAQSSPSVAVTAPSRVTVPEVSPALTPTQAPAAAESAAPAASTTVEGANAAAAAKPAIEKRTKSRFTKRTKRSKRHRATHASTAERS